ncbi:MAG: SRPBCC domain-containing protein [Actinomycetota bacterium]|nr:SRPBCC domain-containing protein [Actinomycetota bacterium]
MNIDIFAEQAGLAHRSVSTDASAPAGRQYRIALSRDYSYPIDDVWSAWTDPHRLGRWLGEPRGELRIGGVVDLVMSPPEGDIAHLQILTCQAPQALSATWCGSWDTAEPTSEVLVSLLSNSADSTTLTLEHRLLDRGAAIGYGAGWEEFLCLLAATLLGHSRADPGYDRGALEAALKTRWEEAAQ